MLDVSILLEDTIKEISILKCGVFFLSRYLFKNYEWKRITLEDRWLLEKLFLNNENKECWLIKVVEKTSSGQLRYQIVKEVQ